MLAVVAGTRTVTLCRGPGFPTGNGFAFNTVFGVTGGKVVGVTLVAQLVFRVAAITPIVVAAAPTATPAAAARNRDVLELLMRNEQLVTRQL